MVANFQESMINIGIIDLDKTIKNLLNQNDGTALTILASMQEKLGHRDEAIQTYKKIYFLCKNWTELIDI